MSSQCGGCGGGCQSQGPEDPVAASEESSCSEALSLGQRRLCRRCGEADETYDRQCGRCFRASMFGKFKLAVTSNAMISPLDNVLVAYSGGPSSRMALQFVHELQHRSLQSWEASKDQSLPVFGVGVAFVDETSASRVSSEEMVGEIERIRAVVSSLTPPMKRLYVAPIESIWSEGFMDGKSRLLKLLDAVNDETGREDLLLHMRMLCLQKMSVDNGFTKLVLGSCTTAIARHVLAATVKGQGYSLPADVHYIDARWGVPVVFPLRDFLAPELNVLCHLDGLKTQQVCHLSHCGINALISSFLDRLQEENPSRARTIVRTAEKLTSFSFNKLEKVCSEMLPSRVRKLQITRTKGEEVPETLCPLCGSPISFFNLPSQRSVVELHEEWTSFTSKCCQSCSYQILPQDVSKFKEFRDLLPPDIIRRTKNIRDSDYAQLSEQIKEFLLPEDGV